MIPYEELVIALQTWRAKQGLPIHQLSGAATAPSRAGPPMAPPSTGRTGPQQAFLGNVATPPPLDAVDEAMDVDESALIEEAHYENEGGDFGIGFGAKSGDGDEATAIGGPPGAPSSQTRVDETDQAPKSKPNRNDDW